MHHNDYNQIIYIAKYQKLIENLHSIDEIEKLIEKTPIDMSDHHLLRHHPFHNTDRNIENLFERNGEIHFDVKSNETNTKKRVVLFDKKLKRVNSYSFVTNVIFHKENIIRELENLKGIIHMSLNGLYDDDFQISNYIRVPKKDIYQLSIIPLSIIHKNGYYKICNMYDLKIIKNKIVIRGNIAHKLYGFNRLLGR
jgi:hypothetical protein